MRPLPNNTRWDIAIYKSNPREYTNIDGRRKRMPPQDSAHIAT